MHPSPAVSLLALRSRWLGSLSGLVLLLSLCGAAPAEGDLRKLFPRTAALETPAAQGSLWRLELPAPVLAACRADLSDLRLLDERGVQVPFVIDRGASLAGVRSVLRRVPAQLLGAQRHESRSVDRPSVIEELYELRSPPPPPAGGAWQLVLETDAASFLRQLVLQSGTLAAPGAELAQGSVFRLRDAHGERLTVPLPKLGGERFLVRLTGEAPSALEPRWVFEAALGLPAERVARVPLLVKEQSRQGTRAHIQLQRPAGIVPSALRVETSTLAFDRHVVVSDRGQGSQPGSLGAGYVFRLPKPTAAMAAAESSALEELELPLAAASGQWLEVNIEDGDSPALEGLAFSAVIHTPSLVFSLPTPSAGQRLQLYFGGGRVTAPRYDLVHLLERQRPALGAERVDALAARLAAPLDNPLFDRTPVLAFALRAGAAVDGRQYARQRELTIASAPDGLARLALEAADLAALRPDLGDLRVADGSGQQWPYLLEPAQRVEPVALAVGDASRAPRSHRSLALPVSPLAPSALLLEPLDSYFDRPYRVFGEAEGGERSELASGYLRRQPGADGPLEIELRPARVRSLELEVEDGDNAPLRWQSVHARVPLPDLYVLAPPGAYRILLGNPAESPPHYDIESARELVLSVASLEQKPGPLIDNPSFRATSRLAAGDGPTHVALWGALVLAVAVLGSLTLRLARQGEQPRR
jgi:hypothetical protein